MLWLKRLQREDADISVEAAESTAASRTLINRFFQAIRLHRALAGRSARQVGELCDKLSLTIQSPPDHPAPGASVLILIPTKPEGTNQSGSD